HHIAAVCIHFIFALLHHRANCLSGSSLESIHFYGSPQSGQHVAPRLLSRPLAKLLASFTRERLIVIDNLTATEVCCKWLQPYTWPRGEGSPYLLTRVLPAM